MWPVVDLSHICRKSATRAVSVLGSPGPAESGERHGVRKCGWGQAQGRECEEEEELMAKFAIVDSEKIAKDVTYEPPLVIAFGVDKNSVGSRTVTMGRTIIPPGGRNPAHHHTCEAAFFVRKGRINAYIGEERREDVLHQNHVVLVSPGMNYSIHKLIGTDPPDLAFTHGNCPSKDDAGTTFVERPWQAPSRA